MTCFGGHLGCYTACVPQGCQGEVQCRVCPVRYLPLGCMELVLLRIPDVLLREEDMGMEEEAGSFPSASW